MIAIEINDIAIEINDISLTLKFPDKWSPCPSLNEDN